MDNSIQSLMQVIDKAEEMLNMDEAEPEEDPSIYTITIYIQNINGLRPVYPLSEVQLSVDFGDEILYQSEKTIITDVITLEHSIILTLDSTNPEMINKFVTTPLIFSLLEYPVSAPDEIIVETGKDIETGTGVSSCRVLWRSEESILDLEQALFGKKTDLGTGESKKRHSKKGSVKGKSKSSKSSQGSKASKKSKKSKTSKSKASVKGADLPKPMGVQIAGSAAVDLMALFLENIAISENLILKGPAAQPPDDRRKSISTLPTLKVDIFLNKPMPTGNMFYYTVESIYNLPKIMSSNMHYQMMLGIPTNLQCRLVPFDIYKFSEQPREAFTFKKYYGSPEVSNFALRDDFEDVKCCLATNLSEAFFCDFPRLEYNVIKGELASVEEVDAFKTKIMKYRCIGLELFMTNPDIMSPVGRGSGKVRPSKDEGKRVSKTSKKGSKKGSKRASKQGSKKGSKAEVTEEKKEEEFLHLMGFIDICKLLCPGEQKTRVACELRTFNMEEFVTTCGMKDSYFRPKPAPPPPPEPKKEMPVKEKKEKKGGKKDKSSKGSKTSKKSKSKDSKSKGSKSSKGSKKGKKGKGDLKAKLPKPPPPAVPSEPVFNEQGYPTFIIIEFEFRDPLVQQREVEDLHSELEEIIENLPKSQEDPKIFKSKYVTEDLFQNSVKTLFQHLKQQYLQYLEDKGRPENVLDFVTFLTAGDHYQCYLNTLTKSASSYCNVSKKYDENWSMDEYHAFIGQAYVDMVKLLNATIHEIGIAGNEIPKQSQDNNVGLLFYAKEAAELDALGLAQQYYLQRISDNDKNADYWLDFGIYKLQVGEEEAAQECAAEALKNDPANRDCLVFFALLIARKGQFSEAETCLLNITISNPKWLLGWMALYSVYQRSKNREGMELCLEMAGRYSKEKTNNRFEDLSWCAAKLPEKYTYKAITYFINMKLLEEAELLIADELILRNTDTLEYLLAILSFLKGHFEHAYDHIEASFKMGRCSYQKNLIRGHIFMAMGKLDCALTEYEKILKSTDEIPYDASIHLLYLRAGLCYSTLGMIQSARKILLKASEKKGTPYSWLATGVLYYHQHDYISAEECLTQSNTLDNVLPETWAYLTLVNIKLGRPNEATNCYHQAIDHRLQNEELIKTIDTELAQWENEFFNSASATQS